VFEIWLYDDHAHAARIHLADLVDAVAGHPVGAGLLAGNGAGGVFTDLDRAGAQVVKQGTGNERTAHVLAQPDPGAAGARYLNAFEQQRAGLVGLDGGRNPERALPVHITVGIGHRTLVTESESLELQVFNVFEVGALDRHQAVEHRHHRVHVGAAVGCAR